MRTFKLQIITLKGREEKRLSILNSGMKADFLE